ncbi:helix-turn-helix domain-containing protein [Corynebacterium kozikiae]|uniref:helix-turn-helix domain-containing protein n=1 Tax=Corynebacterium kozikiae TaxID=2968469 RepID=UPI00211BDFA8|nr:helix-turn-helix transcriptional regulator [Corynebacterium sp. 76QC2CO]MCQ9344248.1 helix-turn-helix transcriptional regulator [Corynebacterium sp. 76QC2CO]
MTLLLWCLEGTVTLNAPDKILPLSQGELGIAPQGGIVTGIGKGTGKGTGKALSFSPLGVSMSGASSKIDLGSQWDEAWLHEFSRSLLGQPASSWVKTLRSADVALPIPTVPPRSHAPQAHSVALQLFRRPALGTSLREFAAQEFVSERTLQRQFLQHTGLCFAEWRAAVRVVSAAEMIEEGVSIADATRAVGFSAPSSLTRAFRRHTGQSPAQFVRQGSEPRKVPPIPFPVPGATFEAHASKDVSLWMYRGTATVTTPEYCRFISAGDTATLPAGTRTRIDVAAGSVALPVPLDFAGHSLDDVLEIGVLPSLESKSLQGV